MTIFQITKTIGEHITLVTSSGKQVIIHLLEDDHLGIEAPADIAVSKEGANYSLAFNPELGIIKVIYAGTVSLDQRIQAVDDVCASRSTMKALKILVDVQKLEMGLTLEEQIQFGQYLANHKALSNARVAVLHKPGHNPNLLIDTSAFNNGYLVAQFHSEENANAWLLKRKAA